MHDIIGSISESADNSLKGKYQHRPDMKNDVDKRIDSHGCASN